jgi:hypothetical protein
MVEAELDRMIEKRSRKGETDPDEQEELWRESVKAYNAEQERERRAEWCEYHRSAAERARRTLEALISHHEEQAERLLEPEVPRGPDAA